jgi:transcriptional regulator with XRE-family HTH domain
VLPTEDESLASVGLFIRVARMERGITQVQAAREAHVSRKQLMLLEKGENVSVKFLLRVARYLGLTAIPLDGNIQLVAGESGLNVLDLVKDLDLLIAVAEHAREFALNAVLPASERRKLRDTPAFREFVARHDGDAERLAAALVNLAENVSADPTATSPKVAERPAVRTARRSRRRKGA